MFVSYLTLFSDVYPPEEAGLLVQDVVGKVNSEKAMAPDLSIRSPAL